MVSALSFSTKAPAKLNLRLKITGRRPDGFHLLNMFNVPIDLSDVLKIDFSEEEKPFFEISPRSTVLLSDLQDDSENIAYKAAKLFLSEFPIALYPTLSLEKHIPFGAGLGGGSSDAAAVLRLYAKAWKALNPSAEAISLKRLSEMGLELGADVPFFIFGVPALVRGIGEEVEPLALNLDVYEALLLFPPERCSTPLMYKAYKDLHPEIGSEGKDIDSTQVKKIFNIHAQANPLAALVDNDFEEVIDSDFPHIAALLKHLRDYGQACASLSGSGSAIFVLHKEEKAISLDFENHVSRIAEKHSAGLRKVRILSEQ